MYAVPAKSLADFWEGLREHMLRQGLADVPERLTAPANLDAHWRSPDLLFSQTCGLPLTTNLAGRVGYVGTPRYRAPGCDGPLYSSAIVVRAGENAPSLAALAGRRVAFNGADSQSGYNALRALAAPLAKGGHFFAQAIQTGAHRASVAAVRTGAADLAAIDCVTLALLRRDHPDEARNLRVLCFTGQAPGLPIITSLVTGSEDLRRLRAAWAAACGDPVLAEARAGLLLDGFDVVPLSGYGLIPAMRDEALARGYPILA